MRTYTIKWEKGCDGPAIVGSLHEIKVQLDELYGCDVGEVSPGSGGPEGAQAPEWDIVGVA